MTNSVGGFRDFWQNLSAKREFKKQYKAIKNSESGAGTINAGAFEVNITIKKDRSLPRSSRKIIDSIKLNGIEIKNLSIPYANREEIFKNLQLESIKTESPELQSVTKALQAMQSLDLSALRSNVDPPATADGMGVYLNTLTSDIAQKKEELGAAMKTLGKIAIDQNTPPALKQAIFDAVGSMAEKGINQAKETHILKSSDSNQEVVNLNKDKELKNQSVEYIFADIQKVSDQFTFEDNLKKQGKEVIHNAADIDMIENRVNMAMDELGARMPDMVQFEALHDIVDQFNQETQGAFYEERGANIGELQKFNPQNDISSGNICARHGTVSEYISAARAGLVKREFNHLLKTIDPKNLENANPEDIQKFKELLKNERLSMIEAKGDDNIALLTKIQRLNQRIELHELKQSGASIEQIVAQENAILDTEKQTAASEKRKANSRKTSLENLDNDIASCKRKIEEFEQKLQNPKISPAQESAYNKGIKTNEKQIELYKQQKGTAEQEIAELGKKIALLDQKLAATTLEELDKIDVQEEFIAESPQDSAKQQAVDLSSTKKQPTEPSEMPNELHETLQTGLNPMSIEAGNPEAKDMQADEKAKANTLDKGSLMHQSLSQRDELLQLKSSSAPSEQIVAKENAIVGIEKQIIAIQKREVLTRKHTLKKLGAQVQACRKQLDAIDLQISDFKHTQGRYTETPPEIKEKRKSVKEKLGRLENEKKAADQEIVALDKKIAFLDEKLAATTLEELDNDKVLEVKAEAKYLLHLANPKKHGTISPKTINKLWEFLADNKKLSSLPHELQIQLIQTMDAIEVQSTTEKAMDLLKNVPLTAIRHNGDTLGKLQNIANSAVKDVLPTELVQQINNRIEAVALLSKIDNFVAEAESMYQLNSSDLASKTINISNEDIQKLQTLALSEIGSEFTHAVRTKLYAVNQWAEKKFDKEIFNPYGTTRSQWLEFVRCGVDEEKINAYKESAQYKDWQAKQDAQVKQLGEVCQKFLEPFKSISDAIRSPSSTSIELAEPIKSWPDDYKPLKESIKPLPDNFQMLQNTIISLMTADTAKSLLDSDIKNLPLTADAIDTIKSLQTSDTTKLVNKLQKKYDYIEGNEDKTWTQKLNSQKMKQGTPDTVKEKEAKVRSALNMPLSVQPNAGGDDGDTYWHTSRATKNSEGKREKNSNGLGLLQGALADKYIPAETKEEINYYLNAVNLFGKFNAAKTESEKMKCVYTLNEIATRTSSPELQRNIRDKLQNFWSSRKIDRTALEWL